MNEIVQDKTHPFSKFGWGNKVSITGKDKEVNENLWKDLKQFYLDHYSADRTYLCIQAKIPEGKDLSELKSWVDEYFSIIPNRQFGKQTFKDLNPNPYDQKMVVFEPVKEQNSLYLHFYLPVFFERKWSKVIYLLDDVISFKGPGSLF